MSNQPGLIETSMPQALPVKRHRQYQIHRPQRLIPTLSCRQQIHQSRTPVKLASKLQLMDAVPGQAGIQHRRSRSIKGKAPF